MFCLLTCVRIPPHGDAAFPQSGSVSRVDLPRGGQEERSTRFGCHEGRTLMGRLLGSLRAERSTRLGPGVQEFFVFLCAPTGNSSAKTPLRRWFPPLVQTNGGTVLNKATTMQNKSGFLGGFPCNLFLYVFSFIRSLSFDEEHRETFFHLKGGVSVGGQFQKNLKRLLL